MGRGIPNKAYTNVSQDVHVQAQPLSGCLVPGRWLAVTERVARCLRDNGYVHRNVQPQRPVKLEILPDTTQ